MKNNIKVLSIILAFIVLPFISKAQVQSVTNTITRNECIPGYTGCVGNTVVLTLSTTGSLIASKSNSYEAATEFFNYGPSYKKITVKLTANNGTQYTSTGTYYLPTTIGEGVIIHLGADGEGVGPYTVYIYKNANYQFTLSVGNTAY